MIFDIYILYQVSEISVILFRNLLHKMLTSDQIIFLFTFFSWSNLGDIKLIFSMIFIFPSSSNMRKVHVPVAERQEQPSLLWSPGYFGC